MRTHVYQAMVNSAEVLSLFTGDDGVVRIYEASSLDIVPPKPFCTYRMHTHFPLLQGHGQREYCQVWVHDIPGDYLVVDAGLAAIRRALESWPAHGDFLEARWIETGVDLKDDVMGTINRYIRFQLTATLRERN